MGFAPTWLRQVSPPPLLHKTTFTTAPEKDSGRKKSGQWASSTSRRQRNEKEKIETSDMRPACKAICNNVQVQLNLTVVNIAAEFLLFSASV